MTEDSLGKAIEDKFYGSHGVYTSGSLSNQVGLEEYRQKQTSHWDTRSYSSSPRAARTPLSLDDIIILLLAIGAWVGTTYLTYISVPPNWLTYDGTSLNWLIAGIGGIVAGIWAEKLLNGPLHFIVVLIRWAIILAAIGGVIYVIALAANAP
ncbi:MAG: hypothetical protein ABF335_07545 [Alphaproteobacteria bacterium]